MEIEEIDKLISTEDESSCGINVIKVDVPVWVDFIGNWKDYQYPMGHCILNKELCGCGYTEYCLNNQIPTILCSPRKILLENKEDQHLKDPTLTPLYYFRNEQEATLNYDSAGVKDGPSNLNIIELSLEEKEEYIRGLKDQLRNYLSECTTVPKILVTYDSLHYVLDVIGNNIDKFAVVVDEFQAFLGDSSFKSQVEITTLDYLKKLPNVLYLSATPIVNKYISCIEYFSKLPYYKLCWDLSKKQGIRYNTIVAPNIIPECTKIIDQYLNGNYPIKVTVDGVVHRSTECVFFVNNVKTICDIIRKNSLRPEQVNILCSDIPKNKKRLRSLGKGFCRGKVPKKGEPHKMFTFCTRTAYLGVDFYSTCAMTVICSNISVKTLSLDISTDLPQILGRQRLSENVFRNEVIYIYKAAGKKDIEITKQEFLKHVESKLNDTRALLRLYGRASDDEERTAFSRTIERNIDTCKYSDNFVGLMGKDKVPVENYMVILDECRNFEITRKDYQRKAFVKKDEENKQIINKCVNIPIDELIKLERLFNLDGDFERKMKLLCDFISSYPNYEDYFDYLITFVPINYTNYINFLGINAIRSVSYIEADIIRLVGIEASFDNIRGAIVGCFEVGKRYTLKSIKSSLASIYESLGIDKTPKATDLEKFFEIKKVSIGTSEKRENGFEIIKII